MFPQLAHLIEEGSSAENRLFPRKLVKLGLAASSAQYQRVLITNISQSGLLFRSSASLSIGDMLQLELPEIGLVGMEVVRKDDEEFGCKFLAQIPSVVVSAVQLASEPLHHSSIESGDDRLESAPGDLQTHFANGWLLNLSLGALTVICLILIVSIGFLPISGGPD